MQLLDLSLPVSVLGPIAYQIYARGVPGKKRHADTAFRHQFHNRHEFLFQNS